MSDFIKDFERDFIMVTDHYGILMTNSYTGMPIYIVYGVVNGIRDDIATCDRPSLADAVSACKYYEKITACRRKKKGEEKKKYDNTRFI